MSVPLQSQIFLSPGAFSVLIASSEDLTLALEVFLVKEREPVLYLCGNYPLILPGIHKFSDRFVVRRALTAFQILTILDEAFQSFLIFEHDRSLFEERADLLPIIGHRCREYGAKNFGILLIATYADMYIRGLEPFFHRVFQVRAIFQKETHGQMKNSKQLTFMEV